MVMYLWSYESPFGPGLVIWRAGAVRYHLWGAPAARLFEQGLELAPGAVKGQMPTDLSSALTGYFLGRPVDLSGWPVDLSGLSYFARRVCLEVRRVSRGRTAGYGEIAAAVGKPTAARAVGRVMAANRLPLFVPCHRILAVRGPGGWSGPPGLKEKLLALERRGHDA